VDLTISRPIKIFALVGVIAMVGSGATIMMKPKQAAAPPVVVSKPAQPTTTTTAPATHRTAATVAPAKAVPAKAKTAAPKKAAAPKLPPVAANGLPATIDAALAKHAIVVVSVFDPQSTTDAISYAEAKAGASDAKVGFVGISLLDSPLAAALTTALPGGGLLPAPGVLIYRRPGALVERIDGFADRDVIAQAAAASMTAPPVAAPAPAPVPTTSP
jgi:hypothetical protein